MTLRGTIERQLHALEMAAFFMLLTTAGVAHVDEVALSKSSLGWLKCSRLCKGIARGVTVTVLVRVLNPVFVFTVAMRVDTVDLILIVDTL